MNSVTPLSFHWRPLIPGAHDPELTWGLVVAATGVIGAGWLWSGLPTPLCPFHALTGIPCPTCGMTRGLRCLLHGDISSAFLFNPLGMLVFFGTLIYLLYACIVVMGKLPRLRWETISRRSAWTLRLLIAFLIAANWLFLILRERAMFQ